ncbi:MAG: metalloregulator ArsR/SmtB family transcription factor [Gammaproteobacteria bacterium]|nr:metalloregulator ArsR/SmtB family transcription factor [Gammaproteobacteria bacterium]
MSNYRNTIERNAERFKALSNPHRLALFQRLTHCCAPGTACAITEASRLSVGELGAGLEIAPSTLSHHLKELNRAGLVQMERRGKQVICWVEPATLGELAGLFTPTTTE